MQLAILKQKQKSNKFQDKDTKNFKHGHLLNEIYGLKHEHVIQ